MIERMSQTCTLSPGKKEHTTTRYCGSSLQLVTLVQSVRLIECSPPRHDNVPTSLRGEGPKGQQTYHLPLFVEPPNQNFVRFSELSRGRSISLMKQTALEIYRPVRALPRDRLEDESVVFIEEIGVKRMLPSQLCNVLTDPACQRADEC